MRSTLAVAMLLSSAMIGACGGGGGASSGSASQAMPQSATAPTVQLFTSSPSAILSGQTATLRWTTSGATSLSIDHGVGVVSAGAQPAHQ